MPVISTPAPVRSMQFGVAQSMPQSSSGSLAPRQNPAGDLFVSSKNKALQARMPQFSGKHSTEAAQKTFLKGSDLKTVVESDPENTLVGDGVPVALLQKTGLNEAEFVESMNQFATSVQDTFLEHSENNKERNKGDEEVKKINQAGTGTGFKALKIDFRGKGNVGWVFDVSTGNQLFVFKVFRCTAGDTPYYEVASGAYFTAVPTSNMSALHLGDPARKRTMLDGSTKPSGWTIMQEINKNSKWNPGRSLEDQGYYPKDNHAGNFGGENHDILLDHGADITKY